MGYLFNNTDVSIATFVLTSQNLEIWLSTLLTLLTKNRTNRSGIRYSRSLLTSWKFPSCTRLAILRTFKTTLGHKSRIALALMRFSILILWQGTLKIIAHHEIYQTLETLFHPISKHREENWNTTRCGVFLTKFEVRKSDETLSRVFDISSQSKQKLRRNKIVKIFNLMNY